MIPNSIGTSYWEYTYDKRGNLTGSDKYTRTTEGMKWQNVANYVYDETNRMVEGRNEQGEYSLYTYNGLGVRVGRELIMKDNTHGYTDFHSQTPSVSTDIDKPEVVKESYVVDYTTATRETLTMHEEGGFDYRWVHGLDRLSVKITSEGTNWWGQNVKQDILKDYTHQDRMGSTTNMTDKFGRIVGRADYNEWGEITYKEALSITSAYRRIWPEANYTGHDWDDVLGMYYAKARFYDPAAKRFVSMDPVKGNVTDPLSLVSYLYCVDNPLKYVDPLGLSPKSAAGIGTVVAGKAGVNKLTSPSAAEIAQSVKNLQNDIGFDINNPGAMQAKYWSDAVSNGPGTASENVRAELGRIGNEIAEDLKPVTDKIDEVFAPWGDMLTQQVLAQTNNHVNDEFFEPFNDFMDKYMPEERMQKAADVIFIAAPTAVVAFVGGPTAAVILGVGSVGVTAVDAISDAFRGNETPVGWDVVHQISRNTSTGAAVIAVNGIPVVGQVADVLIASDASFNAGLQWIETYEIMNDPNATDGEKIAAWIDSVEYTGFAVGAYGLLLHSLAKNAGYQEPVECTENSAFDTPAQEHSVQPDGRNLPVKGKPGTSIDLLNPDGTVKQRRFFDSDGMAKLDIDYNHSGAETHEFPHIHRWDWGKEPPRQPWEKP